MKVLADNLEKLTNNITVPEPEQFDQFEENDTMTNEDTDSNSDLIANLLSGNSGFDDTLQPEISDELKAILEQNESAEVLGPLLSAKVAAAFMKMPSQLLSKETLQKLKDMYKVPENCKLIGVPKVNSEIWSSLPSLAKSADAKLQFQQQHLSRIIIAQACLADEILKLNKMEGVQADKLLKLTMASTSMACVLMREVNMKRKTFEKEDKTFDSSRVFWNMLSAIRCHRVSIWRQSRANLEKCKIFS